MSNIIIFADSSGGEMILGQNRRNHNPQKNAGPYRIATEIRNGGFSCTVVNFFTYFKDDELDKLCRKYITSDTLVVSFSTTFWTSIGEGVVQKIKDIIERTKNINNNVKIVFGGPNGLTLLHKIHHEIHQVDAIFLGYSELKFLNYVQCLGLRKEIPTPTRQVNNTVIYDITANDQSFDFCRSKITYLDEDCIDHGEPMVIEVGRGCIFKCKFCAYPLNGKKKLDYIKNYDVLVEELIYNYENFKIDKYILSDDTFNDSKEKVEQLHKIFTSLPFKINFVAYLRLDLLNAHREHINMLSEMGLVATQFGIETFHDKAAKCIGKGILGSKSKELLHDLKTIHWKDQVKIQTSFIIGLPYETRESCNDLKNWILDPENLVDKVTIEPLGLANPTKDKKPYKSEFQLQSMKYGYYWNESDKNYGNWKNYNSEINTRTEAELISKDLNQSILVSNRNFQGGFSLFTFHPYTKYFNDFRTYEEQKNMNRFEYSEWINKNVGHGKFCYVQNYKRLLLN
jgi:radical SAM superfamily enzyme YgiQ (UPF0313 family)